MSKVDKKLSRRKFILLSSNALAGAVLVACNPTPAETETVAINTATAAPVEVVATKAPAPTQVQVMPTATEVAGMSYNESPMLKALVEAGKLPPVEKRLPANPVVVEPTNGIGKHGGTIYCATTGLSANNDISITMRTALFRMKRTFKEVEPQLCAGYEWSNEYKTLQVKLVEDITWSDGKAKFTTDDVLFYFDDFMFDKELTPAVPGHFQSGGEPVKVTKIDDYTFQFDFAAPYPSFRALWMGEPFMYLPKHYMEKLHVKYNPKAEEEAKAAGFESWQARFLNSANWHFGWQDTDMPVLDQWIPVKKDAVALYYVRNPYYWKVDTEGNQLPYIDECVVKLATDREGTMALLLSNQIDFDGNRSSSFDFPMMREAEASGNYTVTEAQSERGAEIALGFNQEHPDPVLKEIFRDVRFRQAMSLAIDRDEVNEIAFLGQAVPRQATILPIASFYKPEWAEYYAQFDLVKANQILDEIGLDKRNAAGIRLRKDGKPLRFSLEYTQAEGPKVESAELIVKHWTKLGIQIDGFEREGSMLTEKVNAGQQDATVWHVDRQIEFTAYALGASGSKLGPGGGSRVTYAASWVKWFNSKGEQGVEPPQEAKDLKDAFDAWQQTEYGTPEYKAAGQKAYDLVAETLYIIGVVGMGKTPVITHNRLKNVFAPDVDLWWGAATDQWLPHRSEQWYLDENA